MAHVRAFMAHCPDDEPTETTLDNSVIVITMSGRDLAKLQAALGVLIDVGKGALHTDLMPLLVALGNLE
jgi:hypothetical protein